jgi:hypothetical protein
MKEFASHTTNHRKRSLALTVIWYHRYAGHA